MPARELSMDNSDEAMLTYPNLNPISGAMHEAFLKASSDASRTRENIGEQNCPKF